MIALSSDTIVALASGSGAAGVAVIRLSGPQAYQAASALSGLETLEPRHAYYATLRDPQNQRALDQAVLLYFKGPQSFTGEDVIELHVHGGQAVIQSVIDVCLTFENIRMADHGEFSKRAYLNGKIDLTKAEAIADLIAAETQAQADLALQQMGGALSDLYHGWAERLTRALAYIEANIDFSDEELGEDLVAKMQPELKSILDDIQKHLDDSHQGERLREGIHVAIIGPPNAGKSTLINTLAQRDVAIVSEQAGTTRDLLEVHLNIGGYPVILIDTAGIRETSQDKIENEGIQRALRRADQADLRLLLHPGDQDRLDAGFSEFENNPQTIVVRSKMDQAPDHKANDICISITEDKQIGIDRLLKVLSERIKSDYQNKEKNVYLTRQRHREHVEQARDHLAQALQNQETELVAEDVRLCIRYLGRITGRVDVEDLLDVIFKDFCIGK